ncbi:hypothetical protein [Barrientosiimonas humi]|uniref:hypothetical protein n=1 Tax=Barrientosiimonas humi TaxID=999931 RepID=UPI00370D5168
MSVLVEGSGVADGALVATGASAGDGVADGAASAAGALEVGALVLGGGVLEVLDDGSVAVEVEATGSALRRPPGQSGIVETVTVPVPICWHDARS